MAVVISPDSEYAKELAKWEKPYVFRAFPRMLYKAVVTASGKVVCCDVDPATREPYPGCTQIVQSETEAADAKRYGWRDGPKEALDYHEGLQRDISTAAAEAEHAATKMTSKAQAERKALDASTDKLITK